MSLTLVGCLVISLFTTLTVVGESRAHSHAHEPVVQYNVGGVESALVKTKQRAWTSHLPVTHHQFQEIPPEVLTQTLIETAALTHQKAIGDVDGDGLADIVASSDETLFVYRAPGWTREVLRQYSDFKTDRFVFLRADDLALADVDRDGDLDAVTRVGRNDDVHGKVIWLENPLPDRALTTPWPRHDIGAARYVKDLAVADVDRDGLPDVAVREHRRVRIFFQNASKDWTRKTWQVPEHEGMDVEDLDGDGDVDVILNGYWHETPANPRDGTYARHVIDAKWYSDQCKASSPVGPHTCDAWQRYNVKVHAADINRDGRIDVVLSHSELPGFPLSWYEAGSVPGNPWVEHVIRAVCDYCQSLQTGDFNLDGNIDVLTGGMPNSRQRGLSIFYGNGGGAWTEQVVQTTGSYHAEVGDVEADGDLDVLNVVNYDQLPLELWTNAPAPTATPTP